MYRRSKRIASKSSPLHEGTMNNTLEYELEASTNKIVPFSFDKEENRLSELKKPITVKEEQMDTKKRKSIAAPLQDITNTFHKRLRTRTPKKELKVKSESKNSDDQVSVEDLGYIELQEANEVFPKLFVGSKKAGVDKEWLKENNIGYIVNITSTLNKKFESDNKKTKEFVYKRISIEDTMDTKLARYFTDIFEIIDEAAKNQSGVLLHWYGCAISLDSDSHLSKLGVSRSASFAIAYLMKRWQLPFLNAYQTVKKARPQIKPIDGKHLSHF